MQNQQKEFGYLSSSILSSVFRGILVGLFSGFAISAFRYLIGLIFAQFQKGYEFSHRMSWLLMIIFIIYLLYTYLLGVMMSSEPDIKGSGIPQVEAELKGLMSHNSWPVLWRKFIAGIMGISSDLLLGREGPNIQIGALSAKGVAEYLELSKLEERILIASGAAAGVSAAFNAPIAGLLFVIEEVYHHFSSRVWITALSASLTANLISLRVFGQTPVLAMPSSLSLPNLSSYGIFLVMGLLIGILAYHYEIVILSISRYYARIGHWLHLKPQHHSLIAFVLIMPLGYFAPRFLYSMVSYGSGLPGGIFLPILTLGACLGAISKAPLTAMILVCEMVGDLRHLMALGTVTLAAYIVIDLLGGAPVYEAMLECLFEGKNPSTALSKLTWIELPVSIRIAGKSIYELELSKDVLITSQIENGKNLVVSGNTKLILGNTITLVL
ncbi:ClC family H(+)/Cl(-) exchange transporter [Streptococcus dentapri]|uniref:ClC family H(+)/Cl(-) exchange transporter n=1 Tax=Streptococcus dentapri TaxID=573564 RepID=A0ABV8CZ24_9STRE